MSWPAASKLAGEADFCTVIPGWITAGTVVLDGPESIGTVESGGFPCAVATLCTEPASTSAWVVRYVAVQCSLALGPSVGCGQLTGVRPGSEVSVTPIADMVTALVLVTR